MADKRLDQENVLTDFDYALIVKGTDVAKISKAGLAKVVGGLERTKTSGGVTVKWINLILPGSKINDLDIVKEVFDNIPNDGMAHVFSVYYLNYGQKVISGYLYSSRTYGTFNIYKYGQKPVTYSLNNGEWGKV